MRALILIAVLAGCAAVEEREARSLEELVAARRADDRARAAEQRAVLDRFLARAATKPVLDVLVISGGGDWGAFGAGVLKGWGRVQGDLARPQFDVVTGVSTGALIAPFAFLGDDASIERIVQLYRNPQKDIAVSRGWLFFLPDNPSFYTLPGLERDLRAALDRPMLERLAAEAGGGRGLFVNTTNVDLGENHAWDLAAAARAALAANREEDVHRILLASAAIPGAFPARRVGDYLYVDGAITGNILYGGETREEESVLGRWQRVHPGRPLPRLRYWVIFNNQLRFPPQVTRERWPEIMSRTTSMATQTSTVNAMRHLYAMAQIARLKHGADVQVRRISIPEDWVPSRPGSFVKEVMNELADLGERMGADAASWRSEAP
jgi:hypothetical protein